VRFIVVARSTIRCRSGWSAASVLTG